MATFMGWMQVNPAGGNGPQFWRNAKTGQVAYGQVETNGGLTLKDQSTGQNTGYSIQSNGVTVKNPTTVDRLKQTAELYGGVLAGAGALNALGSAGAVGGANEAGQMAQDTTLGNLTGGGPTAAASLPDVTNTVTDMSGNVLGAGGNVVSAGATGVGTDVVSAANAGKNFFQRNPWLAPVADIAGGVAEGLIQNNAINNALKAQQAATQQALGINQNIYNTARADYAPYMSIGRSATNTLGGLLGLDTGSGAGGNAIPPTGTTGYTPNPTPLPPMLQRPAGMPTQPGATVSLNGGPPQPPSTSMPTSVGQTAGQSSPYATTGNTFGSSATERTVLMRAPTGETSSVPQSQVAHYQQMGAQVLGA